MLIHNPFAHVKTPPKTFAKKSPLDGSVDAKPEPYRLPLPNTGQFRSVAQMLSKSAQSRQDAEKAFTPKIKPKDTPVDWTPDQQAGGNPIPKKPEAVKDTSDITKAIAGLTTTIGTLQDSLTALNTRVDSLASQLESTKATTAKIAPSVMKMERVPLSATELQHLQIRKSIADQHQANEAKLISSYTAPSGIESRMGFRFR